jgi:glutaredoxin
MCVLGYDGTANSGKKYFYVLNSWGPDAHPKPLQGEPPGGFWVTWEDLDRIVKQGDSWAFSSFDGFRKTDIDWSVFKGAELGPVEVIAIMFSDTWYGFFCGAGFICLLLAFWVNRPQLPHLRRRIPYQMSLLLLASLMTSQLVAAERVTFRAWHEDGSKTVFREWGDQRVMFAAWSDERPVVTAYTPEWCVQCKLLKKTLGDGDERFRMRYVSDEKSYPAFIQQYVVTNDPATGQPRGYPVMHWAALNGRARMVHGSRWSRDQVWAFVSGN